MSTYGIRIQNAGMISFGLKGPFLSNTRLTLYFYILKLSCLTKFLKELLYEKYFMLYVFPSDSPSPTVRCCPSPVAYGCIVLIILFEWH